MADHLSKEQKEYLRGPNYNANFAVDNLQ